MAQYLYLRVSTASQGFDQQLQDIKAYGINPDSIDGIIEEHESGGKSYTDRKFQQLLNRCKPGDTIYAASTDRLGRSFTDMIRLMNDAKERGIIIVACKQNIRLDSDDIGTKILLTVTAIIDEDERKRIKHRTANKKAWQREQINKYGYFIIENGPNAGERCTYIGNPKWDDMTEAQRSATIAAREASIVAKQDAAILWRESSKAYKRAIRKRAEGWNVTQITADLAELYDENPEAYGTPTGCKPTKGTVSKWLREASPMAS